MKKYTKRINNLKIVYLDNEISSDVTIVFVHGNSLNFNSFKNQYVDSDLSKNRLIALDFPGHGASDKATNYSVPLLVTTIAGFCNTLELKKFVIVGHSLGGHIAIQALPKLKKCIGAFIFGALPVKLPLNLDEVFLPHPVMPLLFQKRLSDNELDMFAKSISFNIHTTFLKETIKATDTSFREQLAISIQNGDMLNEASIVENLTIPIGLILGSEDAIINKNYFEKLSIPTLWQNKLIVLPNGSHCLHVENPNLFNKFLNNFIIHCDK